MSARVATVKSLASIERGRSMREAIDVVRISALPVSASAPITVPTLGAGAGAATRNAPPTSCASNRSANSPATGLGAGAGAAITAAEMPAVLLNTAVFIAKAPARGAGAGAGLASRFRIVLSARTSW